MKRILCGLIATCFLLSQVATAQSSESKSTVKKKNKFYTVGADEAFIFSMANVKGLGVTNPRFSYIMNAGIKLQQDLSKKLTWFTGLEVKNVGIAQRDSVTRDRFNTYYAGIPLGLKIKIASKSILGISGGVDYAFYGKDKTWNVGRSGSKIKTSGFFPESRTAVNPYAALSFKKGPIGLKATYYFQDYFKSGFYSDPANLFNISILFGKEGKQKKNKFNFNSVIKKKTRENI
jgi:hypothetical protein